jgi:Tfp pilus assembly protein PilO
MQRILSKREKAILSVTLAVVCLSLLYSFIADPILSRNSILNQEIYAARTKLKKYLLLLNQKDNIQKKYERFSSGLSGLGAQEGDIVGVLSEIELLAKNSGINILDIRPQAQKGGRAYKESLVELRTEGAIENYLKFIYDIENSLLLLRIKEFQINSKPNSQLLEATFFISKLSLG